MGEITVAVIQMAMSGDAGENMDKAEVLVRQAVDEAEARIVLLPELFSNPYFCKDQDPKFFNLAMEVDGHPLLERMSALASELRIVIPASFFENAWPAYFNSVAVIDADGTNLGVYRKTHIPDGPGYQEKYYFSPGDTGFRVFNTRYGRVGVGICWDQWFPEAARAMALLGADILLYPTAIGSEPREPDWDSSGHWARVMQGHAAANIIPVMAANRIGREKGADCSVEFYGSSFIAGPQGDVLIQADREEEVVLTAEFDFEEIRQRRAAWGLFRDRRPEHYGVLLTLDGKNHQV